MRRTLLPLALAACLLGGTHAALAGIVVDGNLSDWGITPNPGGTNGQPKGTLLYDGVAYNGYQYPTSVPKHGDPVGWWGTGVFDSRAIYYHLEDTSDTSNDYRVGPLYGGQNYDAEALLVHVSSTEVYIAIATGQRFDNGRTEYAPGDIYIADADGNRLFGIEVGGGVGSSRSSGTGRTIEEGDPGTYYKINSDGSTNSVYTSTRPAGSVWKTTNDDWKESPSSPSDALTQLKKQGGTYQPPLADYIYLAPAYDGDRNNGGNDDFYDEHAFIELCFAIDAVAGLRELLEGGATFGWSPVCDNDRVCLEVLLPPSEQNPPVPEPAGLMIWGGLLVGCGWLRRRTVSGS